MMRKVLYPFCFGYPHPRRHRTYNAQERDQSMRNPPVELIAFDLDGTVFGRPTVQAASPRLESAFKAAHEAGVVLAAATGRPSWMIGDQLGSAPWLDWAIAVNGALVAPMHGAPAGAEAIETPFPRETALQLLDLLDSYDAGMSAHTKTRTLVQNWTPAHLSAYPDDTKELEGTAQDAHNPIFQMFGQMLEAGLMVPADSVAAEMRANPGLRLDKLDAILPGEEACKEAVGRIHAMGGLEVARVGPEDLEITVAGVSKGAALEGLCASLGIDPARAAAFGDSGNDISMAGRANTFVAMGNATPEVKAAADEVCGTVLDDGVAVWIEENVLEA